MHRILIIFLISITSSLFGQGDSISIDQIIIRGNKITKERIIKRELTFKKGDVLLLSDTAEHIKNSENNLYNTALFNFTEIEFKDTLGLNTAIVALQERWYLWPQVTIKFQERNFSEWWRNKNFSRIDYGLLVNRNNFLGLNQTLQGQFYYGFTRKFGVKYQVPYIDKKQSIGLKIAASYATQNEVFSGIEDNKMVYLKNDSNILFSDVTAVAEISQRRGFYTTQLLAVEYKQIQGRNELNEIGKSYFGVETSFLRFLSLNYRFKIDKRYRANYPLTGYFFDLDFRQFGLGDIDGSKLSITSLGLNFRQYLPIKGRNYFAYALHSRLFAQKSIPFRFKNGLGFHEYVRGYEPYVMFGQSAFLAKTNYKFQLVSPKSFTIPGIKKWKKFSKAHFAMYWNVYADAGYVNHDGSDNPLDNKFLAGVGTGVDWVAYYDMVIRTEVSYNLEKEFSFQLAFVAPI